VENGRNWAVSEILI